MRTNEATGFERKYVQSDRKTTCYVGLKPKRVGFFNGGGGQNIRSAIPGGVVVTEETPKMKARRLAREAWFAKRTWMGSSQGWVLLEDDNEDGFPEGTPICVEHGGPFDDNDGKDMCKTCEDWIVTEDDYDNGLDPARTHIIGGVVDHGTHTTAVCSDECWCKPNSDYALEEDTRTKQEMQDERSHLIDEHYDMLEQFGLEGEEE